MNARTTIRYVWYFVPGALVGATMMLLTACAAGEQTANGPTGSSQTTRTTSLTSVDSTAGTPATQPSEPVTGATVEPTGPVPCGPVEMKNGNTQTLFAMPGAGGLVGCADALNVIAEYNATPGKITTEPVSLSGQWRCAALDEGADPGVGCAQGPAGSDPAHGLYFETEPGDVP